MTGRRRPVSNTKVFSQVVNGAKTVTEAAVPGWELTSIDCNDGNPTVDVDQASRRSTSATTNTSRVRSRTRSSARSSSRSRRCPTARPELHLRHGLRCQLQLTTARRTTSAPCSPATTPRPRTTRRAWDLQRDTCSDGSDPDSIDLAFNETVTCTFNNRQRGTITIVKDAIPDEPQDFAFTTTGAGLARSASTTMATPATTCPTRRCSRTWSRAPTASPRPTRSSGS